MREFLEKTNLAYNDILVNVLLVNFYHHYFLSCVVSHLLYNEIKHKIGPIKEIRVDWQSTLYPCFSMPGTDTHWHVHWTWTFFCIVFNLVTQQHSCGERWFWLKASIPCRESTPARIWETNLQLLNLSDWKILVLVSKVWMKKSKFECFTLLLNNVL